MTKRQEAGLEDSGRAKTHHCGRLRWEDPQFSYPEFDVRAPIALTWDMAQNEKLRVHDENINGQIAEIDISEQQSLRSTLEHILAKNTSVRNTRHLPKYWKDTKIMTSREFLGLVARHLFT